jgi:outer membrane protein TolC
VRDAREARLQAALLAYRQAVLRGAAEVESDLAALHASAQRLQGAGAVTKASRNALAMSKKMRGLGQADGLQLADAELALSESELDREQARLAHGLAYVALYKALGGAPLPEGESSAAAGAKP